MTADSEVKVTVPESRTMHEPSEAWHWEGRLQYGFPTVNGQPLRDADCQLFTPHRFMIANVSHGPVMPSEPMGADVRETNARRLAACWNACIGVSTKNLERGAHGLFLPSRSGDESALQAAPSGPSAEVQ